MDSKTRSASSINSFTFELYKQAGPNGNFLLSPYSAAMALAILELGSRGSTKLALDKTLGLGDGGPDAHRSFAALLHQAEGGEPGQNYGEETPAHILRVANALWIAKNYELLGEYVESAKNLYAAEIANFDASKAAESAQAINGWVEKKTNDKIKNLVPERAITELTRLIVVNAVYLKARWREPFREENTADRDFFTEDGRKLQVPTMYGGGYLHHHEDEEVQVVQLPYWSSPGSEMTMVIAVPKKKDALAELEASLSAQKVDGWIGAFGHGMVHVYLPKWKYETRAMFTEPLKKLGLDELFADEADLSGVSSERGLHVSEVLHKTYINVDEKGTEAAAATAIMVAGAGIPPKPMQFRADRPFLYFIREAKTGAILFIGRVANPASGS
jgi:serpin B